MRCIHKTPVDGNFCDESGKLKRTATAEKYTVSTCAIFMREWMTVI
jgi:hypothetical protein